LIDTVKDDVRRLSSDFLNCSSQ